MYNLPDDKDKYYKLIFYSRTFNSLKSEYATCLNGVSIISI